MRSKSIFLLAVLAALAALLLAPAAEARCLDLPCGGYVRAGARAPTVLLVIEPEPAAAAVEAAPAAAPNAPSAPVMSVKPAAVERELVIVPQFCATPAPPLEVPDGSAVSLRCASATLP